MRKGSCHGLTAIEWISGTVVQCSGTGFTVFSRSSFLMVHLVVPKDSLVGIALTEVDIRFKGSLSTLEQYFV